MVATNRAFENYRDLDPTFSSTREHQLLIDLSEAVEAGDQEVFADKLFQYDQMSKLDKWKTTILLRIKNAIEEKGEDFSWVARVDVGVPVGRGWNCCSGGTWDSKWELALYVEEAWLPGPSISIAGELQLHWGPMNITIILTLIRFFFKRSF
jgi:hypothetical protein